MLSPSDFNNAVPQFTNGNYASNPINPQYIAEPDAVSYNRGTEPLQTLPAQWWNWFLNKFTGRFNKVNVYVKNIFNELAQILSIFNIAPDGTEATPTTSQLKTVFESCYPQYVKTAACLVGTETTVNGHPLSSNVTVTRSDLGLGTSATVNTGTAAGCIPTVGTALGTTNNNILVTDASGNLKPSGITVGTAAGCDASAFRASNWTPTLVECAKKGLNGSSYATFGSNAFNSTAFTTCTGTVTQVKIGSTAYNPSSGVISLPAYPSTPLIVCCAKCNGSGTAFGASATKDVFTRSAVGDIGWGTAANRTKVVDVGAMAYWNGAYQDTASNLRYYCGGAFGSAAKCDASAFRASNWTPSYVNCARDLYKRPSSGEVATCCIFFYLGCSNGSTIANRCTYINGADGYYHGNICGNVCGTATSAGSASSASSATTATCATRAGSCYCDADLFVCINGCCYCNCCTGEYIYYGYICNKNSIPAIFTMPVLKYQRMIVYCNCTSCCVCCYVIPSGLASPGGLMQLEPNSSKSFNYITARNCTISYYCEQIPYRLLGYTNK